jgi:hypothetical protein
MKPSRIAVVKDLILFFGGLTGIAYQQITGNVNVVLLMIFTAMTGVPGLMNIISLVRNSPTESPSSQHQQPSSPSALDSASTNLPGGEP